MILSEQDIAEISLSAVTVKDAVADARAVEAALLAKLASAELPEPALPTHAKGPMFTADQLHASLQSSRVAFEQVCKHRDALQGENERLLREVVNRNQRALDGDKAVKVLDTTVTELEALRAKLDEWQRQEPVGHFLSNYGEEGLWLCCKAEIKGMTEPLYAAPKALEPLTDDRIGELQVEHLYLSDDGYSIRGQWEFARAIEASHGITKGTP